MKKGIFIKLLLILLLSNVSYSCEEYLDRTDYSEVTEEDIFDNYHDFQGFVDGLYARMVNFMGRTARSFNAADDVFGNDVDVISYRFPMGDYYHIWHNRMRYVFRTYEGHAGVIDFNQGIWDGGWKAIRRANLGFDNFDMLVDASQEEKDLLLGQMYFFRAWYHYWIAVSWGGIPYIDELMDPADNLKLPRLSLEETLLRVAEDFNRAAHYLPWDWNETTQGTAAPNSAYGRVTKGAALAMKSRTYLYLASPWIEGLETGVAGAYNTAYCDSSAAAAAQVINSNRYSLVPWDEYSFNFAWTNNFDEEHSYHQTIVSPENIFTITPQGGIHNNKYLRKGNWTFQHIIETHHLPLRLAGLGKGLVASATQNFINMYETSNGYPIDHPDSNYDPDSPWENRDPRMLKTILLDGTLWRNDPSIPEEERRLQTYSYGGENGGGGLDIISNHPVTTAYVIRKYMCYGVWGNPSGPNYNEYRLRVPYIRLVEMYLNYAEAVNEMAGPNGTLPGESMTAVEAINTIRNRVKLPENEDISLPWELNTYSDQSLPDVPAEFTASREVFRERIRNERSIELAFEAHRWFDIRRWFIAHTLDKRILKGRFDKDHTNFEEEVIGTRVFEYPKHYLLPFNRSDVYLYEDFEQNPGWE